jgi:hypothetical protein
VEYLDKVESKFTGSAKVYVRTLIKRLTTEKYFEGGVRDHILRMTNVVARLKPLDLAIKDGFLIYLIFISLRKEFETFEVNYNSMNEKWTLEKFMPMCVQEEERIRCNNGGVDSVNLAKHNNKKRNLMSKPAPKNEEKGKGVAGPLAEKDQCKWCFKIGHYQKNCIEFLNHLTREDEVQWRSQTQNTGGADEANLQIFKSVIYTY